MCAVKDSCIIKVSILHIYNSLTQLKGFTCTHFLKVGFVVAWGDFYSYHIHQGNKSDKERENVRKKISFMHTKGFNIFLKIWVQFPVCAIPRLPATRSQMAEARIVYYVQYWFHEINIRILAAN